MNSRGQEVLDRAARIRDIVNGPRLSYVIRQRGGLWFQLCSSMDVIEDATLAIAAYSDQPAPKRQGDAGLYLSVYGVLQALILQQDAIRHMYEALSIPYDATQYLALETARTVRNNASGHPTRRDRQKPIAYYFVSRTSLTKESFTLMETTADGLDHTQHVDLAAVIGVQQEAISAILATMTTELEQREEEHRRAFVDRRLSDAFDPVSGYYLEKISEGFRREESSDIGQIAAGMVLESLERLATALAERGMSIETFAEVELLHGEVKYAAEQARRYLAGESSEISTAAIGRAMAYYLRGQMKELEETIEEIDRSYREPEV